MKQRRFSISTKPQHGVSLGVSLVEAIVAMGIATVMMGVSIMTMQTVMRAERETSKAAWLGSSFHRLSRILRSDIHAANSIALQNGATLKSTEMTIQKPDNEVVQYRIQKNRLFRVVTQKGEQVHQDAFYLPAESEAYFFQRKRLNQAGISIDRAQQAPALQRNKAPENKAIVNEMSIISTIGFDYRLTSNRKKQSEKDTK